MTTIEVFDPAMCCSTGVCGPTVEPHLARFEADLRWVSGQGAQVARHNLGQEPAAFAGSTLVRGILQAGGEDALPVILIDGKLKWAGHYPSRDELAATIPATATDLADTASAGCCGGEEQAAGCCPPAPAEGLQITGVAAAAGGCC